MILILSLYGLASISLTYLLSLPFKNHSIAQGALVAVFIITPFSGLISLISVGLNLGAAHVAVKAINRVYAGLSPLYSLMMGFLVPLDFLGLKTRVGEGADPSLLNMNILGTNCAILAGQFCLYFGSLLLWERRYEVWSLLCCCCCCGPTKGARRKKGYREMEEGSTEDSDVAAERERINNPLATGRYIMHPP